MSEHFEKIKSRVRLDHFGWSIALTFCECGENGNRMEQIGKKAKRGMKVKDLECIYERLKDNNQTTPELYYLSDVKIIGDPKRKDAAVLVIRNGARLFLSQEELTRFTSDTLGLDWDKHKFMYGRVVNAKMRYNLCFADFDQEPDYDNKKGRIYNIEDIPGMKAIRDGMPEYFGEKSKGMICEGNYYYDSENCAIGPHIDDERSFVFAVRLGDSTTLTWRWYQKSKPVSDPINIDIHHGDMYIMSHYATGHSWGRGKEPALRHSAGAKKYRIPADK